MNAPQDRIARFYAASQDRLARYAQMRFPGMCRGRIEDAVEEALLAALEKADRLSELSDASLLAWFRKTTFFQVRGQWRRHAYRKELGGDALDASAARVGGHAAAVDLMTDLRPLLREAAEEFGGGHVEELHEALVLVVTTGASDVEAAAACGVRRESVNRAKSALRDRLVA